MHRAATPAPAPTIPPAATGRPARAAHLLSLVRKLIDYAKDLAATFQQDGPIANFADHVRNFGTADIALILVRITNGLLRAQALEARVCRGARRLDAGPTPVNASSPRTPRAVPAAAPRSEHANLVRLPMPEWIAAEMRRRPIGAVIADICRDLGITAAHPLWRELSELIILYDGNLTKLVVDICKRSRTANSQQLDIAWIAEAALPVPRPAACCTGPP